MSTRTKHGTTWAQAILLHLIHGPELPAPLPVVSPWIDHLVEPLLEVLGRLEAPAIEAHGALIAAHLHHPDDDAVRLACVRALGRAPPSTLTSHAAALVERLADEEPAVRWAVVDALDRMEASALAAVTMRAVDTLLQQHDVSIAKAAVASWTPKLERSHPDVMSALARVSGVDT